MNLFIEEGWLCLSFPYNDFLIDKVKAFPGARWEPRRKYWKFPCTKMVYKKLQEAFNISCAEVEVEEAKERNKFILSKHKYKTNPMKHQLEGMKNILREFNHECSE
ncbi:MAG: hypothetical protein ABIG95_02575 [Candidatus Woesearchaeota archaeon]